MEVKPTQPQITTIKVDVAELKAALSNWKVGESLLAVARESSQQGRVMLQIGNLAVEAKSDQPIRAGQQLQLVVERLTPSPVMRVVDNIQPPSPQSIALKNLLPLQRPISELLANLTQLTQTKVVTQLLTAASTAITPSKVNSSSTPLLTPTLPGQPVTTSATTPPPGISRDEVRAITQLAQRLVSQISSSSDISKPGALEQAIKSSGNFFEANLLKGLQGLNRPTPNSDFKAPLLQLLDLLRTVSSSKSLPPSSDKLPLSSELTLPGSAPQAPARFAPSLPLGDTLRMLADLLKQVEGSLARIQLNQLTSTPHQATEAETRPAWLIELPLRNGERIDLVQMKFEEERGKNSDGNAEKQWSVKLAFDLDTIGPLHIKVTYAGGSISTIFWAEQHDSAELFKANMGELEQRLTKAGLVVNKLDTHSGAPPFKNGLLAAESILDEKA